MEVLRGVITNSSEGYDSVSNTFTIMHGMPDVMCVPYGFTMKNQDNEFEAIEVSSVEFDNYRIKVYFGSLDISDTDEIAYAFNIVTGEESNSDSYSWEEASRTASVARPVGVQYSEDGLNWLQRAPVSTRAIRFSHDGGESWGNAVYVGNIDEVITSIPNSTITLPVPHNADGDLLKLIAEFCNNEQFIEDSNSDSNCDFARRVMMDRDNDIMSVSSNGIMVPVPDGGLGLPYYGQSVTFTLDNNRFCWYRPGHTYYCRWRWSDSRGGSQDWSVVKFTYDLNGTGVAVYDILSPAEPSNSSSDSVSISSSNSSSGPAVTVSTGSSITLPVPFDDDGDTIKLIIGFCSNEDFYDDPEEHSNSDSCSNAEYVRYVCMGEDSDVFRVSSNGRMVPIPDEGLGDPYYGQSVTLTMSNDRFRWYNSGSTYYVRAKWIDSKGGASDWSLFKLTYDFGDVVPVQTEFRGNKALVSDDVSGEISVNYLNGKTQVFNLSGNASLNSGSVSNLKFGYDMSIIIKVTNGASLAITGTSTVTYNSAGTYVVRAIMLDDLILTVSEVI